MTVISQETLDLAARHLGVFHAKLRMPIRYPTVRIVVGATGGDYFAPISELKGYRDGFMEVLQKEMADLAVDREITEDQEGREVDHLGDPLVEKMSELNFKYRQASRMAIPSRLLEFYDGYTSGLCGE